ncbi:sugar phosphate isomerase/epimerase family protein [Paenibacillus gansuensis]|uniref:Sugar phosphate isomerase/epimerase family protein n=1 Tax=Paenibacillus gansuensis TaxID=306542 RepID=A0ABW5PKT2_9BACL
MTLKLSVFTVSAPHETPEELCNIARETGVEGIEWRCTDIDPSFLSEEPSYWRNNRCTLPLSASDEEISRFRSAAEQANRKIIALTPYLGCDDLENTERAFRSAAKLGAKMMRVGVPGYNRQENYNDLFDKAVRYLSEVESLSKSYGVKALVETHHVTITASASLAHRLVSRFHPDHVGVLYDPGNMVFEGYENYLLGMQLLGPYLAHVHVKNAGMFLQNEQHGVDHVWSGSWLPLNEGIVPWKQVLADLKAVGYDGWYGVEDFTGKYSAKQLLEFYVTKMKEWTEES